MRLLAEFGIVLLLASTCAAQAAGIAAEIRHVNVSHDEDSVKIEITLSSSVNPTVTTATSPDRLVLIFPNTTAAARQQHIAVNRAGVKQVRIGLNSSDPLVTRVVVDLDAARRYELSATGNQVTLTILPAAAVAHRLNGAVAPENGPLIAKLWPFSRPAAPQPKQEQFVSSEKKPAPKPASGSRSSFQVKYVAEGAAYLNGGRSSGLAEGMKLAVRDLAPDSSDPGTVQGPAIAELQVVSVAETSAVTEIHFSEREVKPGDWAFLSAEDSANRALHSAPAPALALTQTAPRRAKLESKPLAEDTRIRGRIGFDYSGIHSTGSTTGDSGQIGLSFRSDMTRIGGTYWNLQGYWRQRFTTNSQPRENTLEDYLDKTYIIQLYYDNPDSKWVAGFGRLYLPYAASIDTIDGGYVGRKVAKGVVAGGFLGSTPNPTAWNYSPNHQIAGSFVNLEGGDYDRLHYTSTAGVALDLFKWQLDRPYVFLENGISYGKFFSAYHSFIVDSPQGVTTNGIKPGTGIGRSYLTVHIQPHQRIGFDIYHNYFRDTPTAATALIGTGLVDKLLYQGISGGVRVEPVKNFALYTTIGQSNKTGDVRRSLNQMYGAAWNDILHTGIRVDAHYSKFDSSFARGQYRSLSFSRYLGDRVLWDARFGTQSLVSGFTANNKSFFADTSFDTNLGRHTFLQSGYTIERGALLNYDQWYLSLGYRFDVKGPVR